MRMLVVLGFVACGGRAAPPPATAPPARDAAPASVTTRFDALLGTPCTSLAAGQQICAICDRNGRIAGVVVPGDYLQIAADDPDRMTAAPRATGFGPRRLAYAIAVGHGTLRAQVLTCPGCERQLGWAIVVALAALGELDAAQQAALQVALGWPASPLLDEAGLRAAAAQAPSRQPPHCTR